MDDILIKYRELAGIFDSLSMGVIILTPDRKIKEFNKSAELLTGLKASEVQNKYCYNLFKEYLCGGKCKYLDTPASQRDSVVTDVRIIEETSGHYYTTKIESPVYDFQNRSVGCMEIFLDHSAFKELIKRIRFDDLRMKLILDHLNIGVLTTDRGNHITFFNKMAETITCFSRSEMLGRPLEKIFGEEFCRHMIEKQKTIGGAKFKFSLEGEIVAKEGNRLPIRIKYMALKNEKDEIIGGLSTITDLSLKYQYNSAINKQYTFFDMVGKDPAMQKIFEIVPVLAATSATVLIEGPTGTGKDLLAKIIHNQSPRSHQPFVKINCASLPDNLLESELFGYIKGAFTGADRDKPGRFQEADKGTIFLDEIGDLPFSLQAKLLRVLEDREFYPLGSRKTSKVDVRIISATNQSLEFLVQEKRFREDLFYRLNVMRLDLPPIKERKGDLPLLIAHVIKRLNTAMETKIERISEDAMEVLLNHDYPGNIRELENILEHAMIICRQTVIERKHLPVQLLKKMEKQTDSGDETKENNGNSTERQIIVAMLRKNNGRKGETAKALNMDRTTPLAQNEEI
jgi:two-component system response regulator HydG